jgi:16S rRNA A1518/A1519 N6-dimethyltransferase RsmA/KsgA/DIM1 with predicted DNA glycosylase/AP lyase activity
MSFSWNSDKYIKLVEKTSDSILRDYMSAELSVIDKIENPKEKTFIDVGAGYGRVISHLSEIGRKVIAVEIDKNLLPELKKRASQHSNVSVIEGDVQNLSQLLKSFDIQKPVLVCLQNTLGTLIGDPFKIISEIIKVAKDNEGEIIISLFIQEGLKDFGIPMYSKLSELVGKLDLKKNGF